MRTWTKVLACLALAATGSAGCTPANPNIDARADSALRRMSQAIAQTRFFQLHSVATVEDRLESGQLAQFSRDTTIVFGRPDRLRAEVRRGPDTYRFWHQGKELTVLDVRRNQYAALQTPEPVDEMLDFLADEHGIIIPLDDLLYPDPYRVLTEHVKSGDYVDQQEIAGRKCDHLLFTQDNVDWQIWIDVGEPAVPRRVVITYKNDPDRPQYEAVLSEWQLASSFDAAQFAPQVPPNARRVEIEQLANSEEGDRK
jgi:hypothetical protein